MSFAVTRSWLPDARTLPSTTLVTPSRRPISWRSVPFAASWNVEVRAATRSPSIWDSALMISSAMPSQKYC